MIRRSCSLTGPVLSGLPAGDGRRPSACIFPTPRSYRQGVPARFERYLTDWTGPHGRLCSIASRMKGSVFRGDNPWTRRCGRTAPAAQARGGLNVLDLDLTSEQELLAATARDVLADHCPPEVVCRTEDDPVGYPAELWGRLGRLGRLDPVGFALTGRKRHVAFARAADRIGPAGSGWATWQEVLTGGLVLLAARPPADRPTGWPPGRSCSPAGPSGT
jgi:hypothetical protein